MDLDSIDFDLVDMVPGDAPLQQADHVPDNAGNPLVVELEEVPDVSPQMPEVPDVDLPPQFKRLKLLRSVIQENTNSQASFTKAQQMRSYGNSNVHFGPKMYTHRLHFLVKSSENEFLNYDVSFS